jgi:hypothetical protein
MGYDKKIVRMGRGKQKTFLKKLDQVSRILQFIPVSEQHNVDLTKLGHSLKVHETYKEREHKLDLAYTNLKCQPNVEFSISRSDNYFLMISNRILCHCYHRIITH